MAWAGIRRFGHHAGVECGIPFQPRTV